MVEEITTAKFSTGVEASVGPLQSLSNAARILLSTRVPAKSLPSQRPETNPIPASTSEFTQRAFALRELGCANSQKLRECRSAFKTSLDLVGGKDPERGVPAAIDQVQRYSELLRERIDYQAAVADWKAQSSTHQNTLLQSIGCETKEELTTRAATLDASYKELSQWLGRLFHRRELKTIEAAKGECEAVAKQISELAAHKSLDQGIDSFSFDDDPALKEIGLKIAQRVRSELVYGSLHELDIEEIPALQVPVELSHKVFIEEMQPQNL